MAIHSSLFNAKAFLDAYVDVWHGKEIFPRGSHCREVEDARITFDCRGSPLTSFAARNLNLNYAKEEFKWYLRANKFDSSIEQHASLWKKIKQPDGSYYSNYGQYIFPNQFFFAVRELLKDTWSRRASMVLLKEEHLFHENTDVVCTYAINFRIRQNQLNMTVHMRSNDVIFGTTNDVFCFSMLYRMVYAWLKKDLTWLVPGMYTHLVDSLHVYERHFEMIEKIIEGGDDEYQEIFVPWPEADEVHQTIIHGLDPDRGPWSKWLMT